MYKQVCRNGKCTAEIENIIPDYTHVQTVSRLPSPDRILSRSDAVITPGVWPARRNGRIRHRQGLARHIVSPYLRLAVPTNESPQVVAPANETSSDTGEDTTSQCRDNVERMAGSLTCTQFLERFGDKYCKHDYIKRNCCASHALMCNKSEE